MKRTLVLTAAAILATLAGCGPRNGNNGMTIEEKQNAIDRMARSAMEDLYRLQPAARQQVENAAGVGVFSNASGMLIFVSAGGGYGVVVDNNTANKVYMKMATGGVGLGLGAKDYRQILIFRDQQVMNKFITSGWNVGAEAGAAASAGDIGGSASQSGVLGEDVIAYTLTESGLIAEANLSGIKYWVDNELTEVTARPAQTR
jgi:lipid-binding SYLF domain-containing protein